MLQALGECHRNGIVYGACCVLRAACRVPRAVTQTQRDT
jgi:hypothetical protein